MKKNGGFVLLKSLLAIAVVLVCIAVFLGVLAAAAKQSRHIGHHLERELFYRSEKTIERLK